MVNKMLCSRSGRSCVAVLTASSSFGKGQHHSFGFVLVCFEAASATDRGVTVFDTATISVIKE
jgi:hypothetical protein